MTLNASGPISLAGTTAGQSIEIELGGSGTAQISLNCTSVRTLAGVPSGAITMPTNFYGKANQFNYTVSSNQTNFCMRAGAVSAGWNGTAKLNVTINSGVIISSNGTGTPAMRIQGSYPGTVTVKNNGTIVGMGGGGGSAESCSAPTAGSAGGTSLKICSAVTFCNTSGVIAGGGGGGGGGYAVNCCTYGLVGGGGGGGGRSSNAANSSGGAGGSYGVCRRGSAGSAGTFASAGNGGASGGGSGYPGGNGGAWGASGSAANGSGGGAGGKATCGASNVTWQGTGTRYGSIS